MSKHLIVVSIDALVFEDLEYARTLPNFARLLDGASVIERVRTIYPSVTHPVHATIITGAPAGVTGIVNNLIFKPNSPDKDNKEWYNRLCDIKCDTLLHAAKRKGLTTAVSTWPVTSDAPEVIDYLVPGILNYYYEGHDDPFEVYRLHGATDKTMPMIEEAVALHGYIDRHPEYDRFQIHCASQIIKKYKPALLLVHPGDVDHARHVGGVFGEHIYESLKENDLWLGELFGAIDEAGIADETDFVVLSDHGQINITRTISPNVYLADHGFIRLAPDGSIESYDAYAKSSGASSLVYLSRKDDKELHDSVYKLLSDMASEGIYGFEKVYTEEETREKYGLFGDFSFVLETDGYTGFADHTVRPAVRGFDLSDYRLSRGTHGHEPSKGPQPTFIAKGPSFKKGVTVKEGSILDHGPTLAAVLGVELLDAVGKPVYDILNEEK